MLRRRKAHRKSRDGCVQCKKRHAKCNEDHPQCLQCERSGMQCSFSSATLTRMPLNEDSLADLELLEHWHRYPVTGDMSEATRHLQFDLVRLGFAHHYLLNSILSLAALQLYSEDQSRSKWYARAIAHQQASITRVRPHFEALDQTDPRALLGFSAITSIYAVAEPSYRPRLVRSLTPFDPIDELLKALRFSRSSLVYVQQNFPPLIVSESWLLNEFGAKHEVGRQDYDKRYPQVGILRGCIERWCAGGPRAACLHAAEAVFRRIDMISGNLGGAEPGKVIWGWGLEVDETFLDLCSERQPVALVVLAHFTVLMSLYQEHWCLTPWPAALLGHVMRVLGDEWDDSLKWPLDVLSLSREP